MDFTLLGLSFFFVVIAITGHYETHSIKIRGAGVEPAWGEL